MTMTWRTERRDSLTVAHMRETSVAQDSQPSRNTKCTTQRQAGSGATPRQEQAFLPRDGNRLRGGSLLHGHRHQYGSERYIF